MFSFFNYDPKARIKEILGAFELPRFRKAVFETLKRLRDPDSTTNQICQGMSTDPDLVSRVMRTVNSTAYAPRTKITSLDHAIAMLGNSNLERIVMVLGARGCIPQKTPAYLTLQQFWKTSSKRAVLAKEVAEATSPAKANLSFSAGFLQDISIPLVASAKPDDYGKVFQEALTGTRDLHTLEKETFGWDHAELGAMICAEWDLPEDLAGCIHAQNEVNSPLRPDPVYFVSSLQDEHPPEWNEKFIQMVRERCPALEEEQLKNMLAQCGGKADELAKMLT